MCEPASSTIATSLSEISRQMDCFWPGVVCSFANASSWRFGRSRGASFSFARVVEEKRVMTTGDAEVPVFVTETHAGTGLAPSFRGSAASAAAREKFVHASPLANSNSGLTDGSRYL